jgi:3-hydroxyisobutyrate dehydrogenase-like beta-hydroxyacid dehydrogenase
MLKDADYALAFARKLGMNPTLLPPAANLFRLADVKGFGANDLAAVVKSVED